MKKIVDTSDSDLNERIALAQTEDNLTALENDVKDMSIQLDKLEPLVTMNIDGLEIVVEQHWIKNKVPVDEIIAGVLHNDQLTKTEKYLRNKYEAFEGVPFEYVSHETGLDNGTVLDWLVNSDIIKTARGRKGNLFVPFMTVAQMAVEV